MYLMGHEHNQVILGKVWSVLAQQARSINFTIALPIALPFYNCHIPRTSSALIAHVVPEL